MLALTPSFLIGILIATGTGIPFAMPIYAEALATGKVDVPGLVEASGAVCSRLNPTVIWTHNDKGGLPEIFAIDQQGQSLATYSLNEAIHLDYEDIAIGPGPLPGTDYLYVGDIGDKNKAERSHIVVYRIKEPVVSRKQVNSPVTGTLEVTPIRLKYPDMARNAEGLMSDPLTGDLYVVTKERASCRIYRASKESIDSNQTVTMSFKLELDFDLASAADISADGSQIIIRNENSAQIWERNYSENVTEALSRGGNSFPIPVVGTPSEKNGEAIALHPSGRGYFTLSDSLATQPLYYFARQDLPPRSTTLSSKIFSHTQGSRLPVTITIRAESQSPILILEESSDLRLWNQSAIISTVSGIGVCSVNGTTAQKSHYYRFLNP